LEKNGFILLEIRVQHLSALLTLPFHHRDPFDRLLISQAQVEEMAIVSADDRFDAYITKRVW
jgi:PIN domain nuclease of toxin-antitoxin system